MIEIDMGGIFPPTATADVAIKAIMAGTHHYLLLEGGVGTGKSYTIKELARLITKGNHFDVKTLRGSTTGGVDDIRAAETFLKCYGPRVLLIDELGKLGKPALDVLSSLMDEISDCFEGSEDHPYILMTTNSHVVSEEWLRIEDRSICERWDMPGPSKVLAGIKNTDPNIQGKVRAATSYRDLRKRLNGI